MSSSLTFDEDCFESTSIHHWILDNERLIDLKRGSYENQEEDCLNKMLKDQEDNMITNVEFRFGLNINDEYFKLLIDSLTHNAANLQHLEFDFIHLNELTQDAIEYFIQALESGQYSNLKSLNLNFLWFNLNEQTLMKLSQAISQGTPYLENLILKFNHSESVFSDSSVISLCGIISQGLSELEKLELSLAYGQASEEAPRQDINEQLSVNFLKLTELKLNLKQITDVQVDILTEIFKVRPACLENLNIHLNSCEAVTSDAVRNLIEGLDEGACSFKDTKIVLSKSTIPSQEQDSLKQLAKRLFRRGFSLEFIF